MKKHLVMIVGGYYPKPSPTGKCAEAYIDLLTDAYNISVICIAKDNKSSFTHNGKAVYPTADGYTRFQRWLERKNAPRLLQNICKVPVHILQSFVHPNNLYGYVKKAQAKLAAIHSKRPIDVIFSVGAPMAAHVAAKKFRKTHPDVRWVTYTVDSYGAQNKGSRRYAAALAFESAVLQTSDRVLLSEEIMESSPELCRAFSEKCMALPYLMPPSCLVQDSSGYFDPEKIHLVYAGRFYKSIRNPEYLLQLALAMDADCVLHLYCQSDCDGMIDDYVHRSNGKIQRHTPVSTEEIQRIYGAADVLVSVGNSTPEFKPSKTFEYIASGKPILNICYEGLRDAVLEEHPLVLQVERTVSIPEASLALQSFVFQNRGKILSRTQMDAIYYKHSSENILAILQTAVNAEPF